jgi:hypothetical protein
MGRNSRSINAPEQTTVIRSGVDGNPRNRLLVVTPTLGIVRMEWAMARYGQPTPCNWSSSGASLGIGFSVPMHYLVADAQNLGAEDCIKKNFTWMLLHEDDVVLPSDAMLQLNKYIISEEIPVVSGLYFLKGNYSEPLLYRGTGNGPFLNFKIGDKVWADGVPTGFLLIHSKILRLMWDESEEYETLGKRRTRRIFETPAKIVYDPETQSCSSATGTSDLVWCARVIREKVLARAGWPKIGRKKYPFLCDTKIFCRHIELATGRLYP